MLAEPAHTLPADLQHATSPRTIRVFLAEDHRITLWGLQRLIDAAHPRMAVLGSAHDRRELLSHPLLSQADVLLLDLDLAGDDGATMLAEIRTRCAAPVLILTGSADVSHHRTAIMQGARGLLHKSETAETILRAIEKVCAGEVWIQRNLLGDVLGHLTGSGPAPATPVAAPAQQPSPGEKRAASLTQREREIVQHMSRNAGAKLLSIASDLSLSEHTLRNHLTTIYSKLGVRGRLELHVFASEHGLHRTDGQATDAR